jgi:predicted transposase YbfD/YdcC
MSSSLIPALDAITPVDGSTPLPVTDGEQVGLVQALVVVADPRRRRGVRYRLASLLAVAVCATLAGATTFAAIADWLHDLDEQGRARLGFTGRVPAGTTVWRLLVRVDADRLAVVLARWLRARARPTPPPAQRRQRRTVIAVDGKTLRGARRGDGTQVHLLSALDTSTGIVLAQVTVAAKSNEIPAFAPLLDAVEVVLGSLTGVVFVADALHTQTEHARQVAARGAHLMVPAKGNQPSLLRQLRSLPWAEVPVGDRRRDNGHARRETRTVKAVTVATPGGLAFPHAQQAIRITRTRIVAGKTSRETAYRIISLPAERAQPAELGDWARREWLIENQVHHVRDVTFHEDAHRARTGNGPAVAAVLRNTAIGFHRTNGETNIARATRRANRRPDDLIDAVTRSYPTTQ